MKWKISVATAVLSLGATIAGQAATVSAATPRESVSVALASQKRELAMVLAVQDKALRQDLLLHLSGKGMAVDLKQWLDTSPANSSVKAAVVRADYDIRQRKGLDREVDSLLQLRLAHSSMLAALKNGAEPLYAYEPDGNDAQWQAIEAFDRFGGVHYLDVHQMPSQPILVVDIDAQKDLAAGLRLMRRSLATLSGRATPSANAGTAVTSAGLATASVATPVTMLDHIRLNDDEEPWISGDAEVYALIAGVDPSRDQPALDLVDMPYLDNDGTTYSPNQILIFWDRYRWAATDAILMEHDDNTNYQTLISNLFTIASQILTQVGQGDIGSLVALGSGLIQAMPGSWFTNDDDYVDSYYTLEKGHYYTSYPGARGNALVSMRPYSIATQ